MKKTSELADTFRIPTLSTSVLKVRELLGREGVGTAEVANALAQDPPLSARVLQIANSAQYGGRELRTSIQAATSLLGLRTVATIVLRAGVTSLYDTLKDSPGFSLSNVWKHSILTAHAAEELAKVLRRRSADFTVQDHYTCGLLHDIGRIVMFDNFGEEYVTLIKTRPEGMSEVQVEASGLMGMDHAELGALAAGMWGLPDPIADLIRYHHSGTKKKDIGELVSITTCADAIADLILDQPEESAAALASQVHFPPPGCKPQQAIDLIHLLRRQLDAIEI